MSGSFHFDNSYARLPAEFYVRLNPTPVASPALIFMNRALADELNIDLGVLSDEALAAIFSGNQLPAGAEPLAMAYAGHQFGNFVPQLGDGRALLLGEVIDRTGRRRDLHFKGSGPTPFSRGGDGRASLGPVMRELVVSEAMHALGIPTTRTLAAVTTGESVRRERPEPGAILTRVAASHIRIGTFEYFASRQNLAGVKTLADYAIQRHYPELARAENPYLEFFDAVLNAQSNLIAQWMGVGFIHGVMNTDNMTISGETIDFGPCAFMDIYDQKKVFSSIDRQGRYAYGNQPYVAQWNLSRLAETLLPLLDSKPERAVEMVECLLEEFFQRFGQRWLAVTSRKLGIENPVTDDLKLAHDFLALIHKSQADMTNSFVLLSDLLEGKQDAALPGGQTLDAEGLMSWQARWRARLAETGRSLTTCATEMRQANPRYIPRNHRIAAAITAAVEHRDYSKLNELMTALSRPFDMNPSFEDYRLPPKPDEEVHQTFCGT